MKALELETQTQNAIRGSDRLLVVTGHPGPKLPLQRRARFAKRRTHRSEFSTTTVAAELGTATLVKQAFDLRCEAGPTVTIPNARVVKG